MVADFPWTFAITTQHLTPGDDNAACSETTISPCSLAHPRFQAAYLLNLQDQLITPFLRLAPKQLSQELELSGTQLEYLGANIAQFEEPLTLLQCSSAFPFPSPPMAVANRMALATSH